MSKNTAPISKLSVRQPIFILEYINKCFQIKKKNMHVYIIYCTNQSSPFLKLMSQLQLRPIPTSHRRCRPSSVSGSRVLILLLYCIAVVSTINGCEWIITQVFCVNTDYILPAILGIIIIIIGIGIGLLLHNWKAHLEWVLWPWPEKIKLLLPCYRLTYIMFCKD